MLVQLPQHIQAEVLNLLMTDHFPEAKSLYETWRKRVSHPSKKVLPEKSLH